MIRRDSLADDGTPQWILIGQVEHARLAGELAAQWGGPPFAPLPLRDVLLPAIYRHDDGWARWERSPGVNRQSGRPLAFTEMPEAEAHHIWRRSIRLVEDLGPLAQYLVASHFADLRRRGDGADSRAGKEFARQQDDECRRRLGDWTQQDLKRRGPEWARHALEYLQMFDGLSLWFCCHEQTESLRALTPDGQRLTLRPVSRERVVVSPWPFTLPRLTP